MSKVERTVKLDPDAADLLIRLAGSPRKQGEYLSILIREAATRAAHEDPLLRQIQALKVELARLETAVQQRPARGETTHDGSILRGPGL